MAILKVKDEAGNVIPIPSIRGKSAYEYAKDGGYTGTEEEFTEKLATDWATSGDVAKIQEDIDTIMAGLTDANAQADSVLELQNSYIGGDE